MPSAAERHQDCSRAFRSAIAIAFLLTTIIGFQIPTASTASAALTCAQGGICVVGDTGPGGGKVFNVSGRNYLEAAVTDLSPMAWSAALAAGSAYIVNNLSGWRIPTLDESKLMMTQRAYLNFASNEYYWTSTESDSTQAYFNNMSFTSWYPWDKTSSRYSRPIRAFSPIKVTPDVALTLVNGLSTAIYRTSTTVRITSSVVGKFTVKANGKSISRCVNLSISSIRDCEYSPSTHGRVGLTVIFTPTDLDNYLPTTSKVITIGVAPRQLLR